MREENVWNFNHEAGERNLYISWLISLWCNFNCSYCFYQDHSRGQVLEHYRPKLRYPISLVKYLLTGNRSAHSFDNYPAKLWADMIIGISEGRKVALKITGGEPFLDTSNFRHVLNRFIECDNVDNIRVDTNGSFLIDKYRDLDLRKVFLNLSFHPESFSIEALVEKSKGFIDAGLNISMVNYVMTPSQRDRYEEVREKFSKIGVAVNPGIYIDLKNPNRFRHELEMYSKYLKEFDVKNKIGLLNLKDNQTCHFPQIGLKLNPDGLISNSCFDTKKMNLMKSSKVQIESLLSRDPVKCPKSFCSQTNKYSFQSECKRNYNSLNPLERYVEDALI